MSPLRSIGFGLLVYAGLGGICDAGEQGQVPDLTAVWRLGAHGSFAEAAAALPESSDGEDTRFTQALLLFNRQPRTDENLKTAAEQLAELARNGTTAEVRARSLYFQARAETLLDPDSSRPVRLYEQLWHDYPDEPYGQRALSHLLLMTFYTSEPREVILTKVAQIEAQADALTDPVVKSQFHQVAARGYLHLGGDDAKALRHLLRVNALGVSRREALGDLHVSIGQLAAEQGQTGVAREHYQAFLKDFPNDPRAYTVKAFLAALPAND